MSRKLHSSVLTTSPEVAVWWVTHGLLLVYVQSNAFEAQFRVRSDIRSKALTVIKIHRSPRMGIPSYSVLLEWAGL